LGEEISEQKKEEAISVFLRGVESKISTQVRYPFYFKPPYYDNKKQRLIQGYMPKTNMLYENHYELEILRLLVQFAPGNEIVREMVRQTLLRIKDTCFGNACDKGECAVIGICVLRFLAAAKPDDTDWIDKLLIPLGEQFLTFGSGQAAVQKGVPWTYLLMTFADLNNEKTREYIMEQKDWLINLLRRGWITGKLSNGKISEMDTFNLMYKYIIRNALGTLPEYEDISKYEIYVNPLNERCYCNI